MRKLLGAIALAAIVGHVRAAHGELLETAPPPKAWFGSPAATLLKDGRVLITGGGNASPVSTAEVFDPSTKTWTEVASLKRRRTGHSALTLANGKVLVVGGTETEFLSSTELYDPTSNTWTEVASTKSLGRTAATLLTDGRVAIVVAGETMGFELFDPTTNAWTVGGVPLNAHFQHYIAPLAGSGLLLASLKGAERFQPATGWMAIAPPPETRESAATATLPDGRVLVVGGATGGMGGAPLLFDPATDSWKPLAGQPRGRGATATVLTGGRVLLAGGQAVGVAKAPDLELFDAKTLSVTNLMTSNSFFDHLAVPLADGRALIVDRNYSRAFIVNPPKGCTAASDCSSGFCVDGFCCDSACAGQCEACDVPPNIGTCTGVTGAPHGAREQCSPPWTPACRAMTCDHSRSRTQCVAPVFAPACDCTTDSECASGHCADGVCCNTACDGQCEACDLPSSRGVCVPVSGEPRGIRKGCPAAGKGICTLQACNGSERTKCVFTHGPETNCEEICGGRVLRHCNGEGLCGLSNEMQCPDTGCSVPSTNEPARPRFFDAVLVVALGALVGRARNAQKKRARRT